MHKTRTKILIHCLLWAVWLSLISLNAIVKWKPIPLWSTMWNFLSVILVFYASYFISYQYCNSVSFFKGAALRRPQFINYLLFRWQVAFLLVMPVLYIYAHWWLDEKVFNTFQYQMLKNDFLAYAELKFTRFWGYWVTGIGLAVAWYIIRKKNHLLQMHRMREENLRSYINTKMVELENIITNTKNQVDKTKP